MCVCVCARAFACVSACVRLLRLFWLSVMDGRAGVSATIDTRGEGGVWYGRSCWRAPRGRRWPRPRVRLNTPPPFMYTSHHITPSRLVPGASVLDVGCGSGYLTACMGR